MNPPRAGSPRWRLLRWLCWQGWIPWLLRKRMLFTLGGHRILFEEGRYPRDWDAEF